MTSAEPPSSEFDILRVCTGLLRDRLPADWRVDVRQESMDRAIDAVLTVTAPSGDTVRYLVEAKRLLIRRDVPTVSKRLWHALPQEGGNTEAMVMSRYLSPPIREALVDERLSFVDATGNMSVQSTRPVIFVRDRGADKDPWRGPGRPRGTLTGEPAARIVRTLVDNRGPWSARDLVETSGASTGATYRVLEFLQGEGLVDKTVKGYDVRDWPSLLRRWSHDYGFLGTNRTSTYIEPRGIDALFKKIADSKYAPYAVTGSTAAAQWAPYAPARAALIYVEDAARAAEEWGLRPVDRGANVILAEPKYGVVFMGTSVNDQSNVIVAPAQAAVDLLTGPGRNPSEGEELISWMELNEAVWRHG